MFGNIFIFIAYGLRFSKELNLKRIFEKDISPKTIKKSRSTRKHISPFVTNSNFIFPSLELLEKPKKNPSIDIENKKNTEVNTIMLGNVLEDFKINGKITEVKQGPIVTLFELTPAPGTQSSTVIRLSEDIARSMRAKSARISTIPGKDALGIEIPNKNRETVFLRELLNDDTYKETKFKLPLTLGKDIFGNPVVVDLAKMPHLLVAGTTGSGKSVGINAMLLSLLYSLTPEECRLILIDPKMLELSVYKDIPHLLTEVVTDPKKAISALKWTVKEMETRYKMMTHLGVREIEDYNVKVKKILDDGEVIFKETQVGYDSETGKPVMEKKALDLHVFSKIVVVVDELADLMITSGKEIESAIQRLSQMARAAGIHLIVATQRPSVDVITGTIKSNFPTRISYKVVNKINSRTILEEQGAEQLLGQGDLLITMLGDKLLRVHGPYVKTEEVQAVVDHLKNQGEPEYLQSVTTEEDESENISLGFSDGGDELYDKAVSIVCREKKASTSFIQRHLQIGYNRAARIIEKMEAEGIVSPANHVGRREVLVGKDN
ncbi:MAG: DNA translocase FtsK [Alphaproteobacteria bacterium]